MLFFSHFSKYGTRALSNAGEKNFLPKSSSKIEKNLVDTDASRDIEGGDEDEEE